MSIRTHRQHIYIYAVRYGVCWDATQTAAQLYTVSVYSKTQLSFGAQKWFMTILNALWPFDVGSAV